MVYAAYYLRLDIMEDFQRKIIISRWNNRVINQDGNHDNE